MGTTPRLNRLLDDNSAADMLPIDRYSSVISFAAGIERELAAEKERSARLEKALKEIASFGIGELRPLADEIAIWRIAKTALGDTNG